MLRKAGLTLGTYCLQHLRTVFLPHRDIAVNDVLQVVGMKVSFHPRSITGVIAFEVVLDNGAHG